MLCQGPSCPVFSFPVLPTLRNTSAHDNHNQALGVFDVRELAYEKSEMSAYIRNGFELDKSVFIDYFTWVKNEYSVRATTVSVWHGQEETLFETN